MNHIARLVRWQNLLFLAVLLWVMHYWVALPVMRAEGMTDSMPWWLLLLIGAGVVCIAAGGYVINDYFDIKIDRINRPEKVIVTETVSKQAAMRLFQVLMVAGMAAGLTSAWLCRSLPLTMVFLLVPGLLWFYSASYKRMFLIGNLIIAFCAALVPLLVAMGNTDWLTHKYTDIFLSLPVARALYVWLGGFALFALLTTLIREIVKDLQDQTGDRELECHTLPIVIGDMWTKTVVTLLIIATIALSGWFWWSVLPFERTWNSLNTRYILFGIVIPLFCETALLWSAKIPDDYRTAQKLMKFVMFIGMLYGFVISNTL